MITVAICTHDRAASLREALESLTRQQSPPSWELLVVDNNSSDGTRDVVHSFAGRLPLRYVFEPAQGLSHARNRVLAEMAGDLVIFTDDDMILDPQWLAAFASAAAASPQAGFFGGRVLPRWEAQRPRWLRDERMALLEGVLGHYDLGSDVRCYGDADPLPIGGSFGLRPALVRASGRFRTDLGAVARQPGRGEETALLAVARRLGARGVYVGSAVAHHKIPPDRFAAPFLFSYGVESGISVARTQADSSGRLLVAAAFLVRGLLQLAKGRGDRFRQCIINAGIQVGIRRVRRGSGRGARTADVVGT